MTPSIAILVGGPEGIGNLYVRVVEGFATYVFGWSSSRIVRVSKLRWLYGLTLV